MRTTESGPSRVHLLHRVDLAAEVEFRPEAAGELVEHLPDRMLCPSRVRRCTRLATSPRAARSRSDVLDAGTLDLHHHPLTRAEPGTVGLADQAAASGSQSNSANTSSTGWPSSASSTGWIRSTDSGQTRFWSCASSPASSGEMRSTRVAAIWPSLT